MIPKGVADGQVIRLRGLGQGAPGIDPGDALLTITFAPHERFTIEGSDLRLRLPVEIEEAVLGGSVRVPTLTGAVEMKIPPMTNSGRTFRLRGKGLPTKTGHGDLLVTTEIRLPEVVDEDLMDYARRRAPPRRSRDGLESSRLELARSPPPPWGGVRGGGAAPTFVGYRSHLHADPPHNGREGLSVEASRSIVNQPSKRASPWSPVG